MASIFVKDFVNLDNASTSWTNPLLNFLRFLFGLPSTLGILQAIILYVGGILLIWEGLFACKWKNLYVWKNWVFFFNIL